MPEPDSANGHVVLHATGLAKTYRRPRWQRGRGARTIAVLQGVELQVAAGEWVTLTGASGCGKTTLLHLLGTLDRLDAGVLVLFGQPVHRLTFLGRARLRRRHLGFVFQNFQLFPELSALENVMLPGRFAGLSNATGHARALQLLDRVGLGDRLEHRPAELSGGEQQRIALARALMNDPGLIFADEPTGNLDAANTTAIMTMLKDLRDREHRSIVMVTHDPAVARFADRVLVLRDGTLHPRDDR